MLEFLAKKHPTSTIALIALIMTSLFVGAYLEKNRFIAKWKDKAE